MVKLLLIENSNYFSFIATILQNNACAAGLTIYHIGMHPSQTCLLPGPHKVLDSQVSP